MEGAAVKLIIKAPNQQIKDQIVKCDIGWTIGRLKEYLSEVYPSRPESSSQKLIYSGQLLSDSVYLKDALRQCDEHEDKTYTVHLVCTPRKTSANKMSQEKVTESSGTFAGRSTMENARLSNSSNVQNQSQDNNNNITQQAQFYPLQQHLASLNSQQITWMQQAYVNYIAQYIQLMAARGIHLNANIPLLQQANVGTSVAVQSPYSSSSTSNNTDEPAQPAGHEGAEVNPVEVVAGEEEEEFNHDWLDVFYMLSRSVLLLSMVYFYCPPERFLMVVILGFTIYVYRVLTRMETLLNNIVRVNIVRANGGRGNNQNQVAGAEQQNQPQGQVARDGRTEANEGNQEERPGALAFTWTFFSSFFTSLIPDQPNVI